MTDPFLVAKLFEMHPRPWKVVYRRVFPSWHEKSRPEVYDANGQLVLSPPQNVRHPGMYDAAADALCQILLDTINRESEDQK